MLLSKLVPTDMDWHGNFPGDFANARLSEDSMSVHYAVHISGNDDTCLTRRFNSLKEALDLYDSIKYIQDPEDLTSFAQGLKGVDNNRWPSDRPISSPHFKSMW